MLTDATLRQLRDHVHGAGGCLFEPQYREAAGELLALRAGGCLFEPDYREAAREP